MRLFREGQGCIGGCTGLGSSVGLWTLVEQDMDSRPPKLDNFIQLIGILPRTEP